MAIELHIWSLSHHIAGKIVDEIVDDAIVDLTDGQWNQFVDGQTDESVGGVSEDIGHVVGHFGYFAHFIDNVYDDQGGIFTEQLFLNAFVFGLLGLISVLGFYLTQEQAVVVELFEE